MGRGGIVWWGLVGIVRVACIGYHRGAGRSFVGLVGGCGLLPGSGIGWRPRGIGWSRGLSLFVVRGRGLVGRCQRSGTMTWKLDHLGYG